MNEAEQLVVARLEELDLKVSPTQPKTPGDGNCMIHGVLDQFKYVGLCYQVCMSITFHIYPKMYINSEGCDPKAYICCVWEAFT